MTITRSLARQLRAVFRRAGIGKIQGGYGPRVLFLADGDTLHVRAMTFGVAVEHRVAHHGDAVEVLVPLDLLAACEGSRPDPVQLDFRVAGKVTASWTDKQVPRVVDFVTSVVDDKLPPFPPLPETFASNDPELWSALREASVTTDPKSIRLATGCIQLRGSDGKLVATDGRQAMIQSGFTFPWDENLLVPASNIFNCRDLFDSEPIQIGRTESRVTLKAGPWTVSFQVEKDGRFPEVSHLIRDRPAATSRVLISDSDGDFLNDALPRLPCENNTDCPVTLDLNGQVLIRGKAANQPRATELVLSNSRLEGDPITVNANREYLLRALRLGFRELHLLDSSQPVLCDDGRRNFLWALLSPESAVPTSPDSIRIASFQHRPDAASPPPQPQTRRSKPIVSQPTIQSQATGQRPANKSEPASASKRPSPIEQATAFRDALRVAVTQANELIRTLKQQKRQARLVQSTLASLRQLQKVGV